MDKQKEFIKAIKENEGVIYKITSIYSNTLDDQKDLYQEIVYQLWKSFDSFKGLSKFREITTITGFTKTNVGTRLARIRQKLKSQINT